MNLVIDKPTNLKLVDFGKWLIPKIYFYFKKALDNNKLIKLDLYLNQNNLIKFDYGISKIIKCKDVLTAAIYCLKVIDQPDRLILEIDPNILIPDTKTSYLEIAKFINYGNLSVNGYPILDECMKHFADNITDYYEEYKESL